MGIRVHKLILQSVLLCISKSLGERPMIIENLGVGERCEQTLRLLAEASEKGEIPHSVKRIFLLPIPTSRDKIHLSGTEKLVSDVFGATRRGDLVAGYCIDKSEKKKMMDRGVLIYDACDDEDFLEKNAEESALGALGYILSSTKTTPKDTSFSIIGYGRIGSALARMLLFLGGNVCIYTKRESVCIELGECGVRAQLFDTLHPKIDEKTDILINTAPTDLSELFPTGAPPSSMRVIELASGNNFGSVKPIERLPSIPDRYYGRSAGRTYFSSIMKYVGEVSGV